MERGISLATLAQVVSGKLHGPDRHIASLAIDSRKPFAPEDALFIALAGKHHDGHRYIPALCDRGVRAFLVEHIDDIPASGASAILVQDTLVALQLLAAWRRAQYSYPVIGITGSNGKTVVKEWLFQLLRSEEHIVRSPGSWNSQVGVPLSVWEMGPEHTLGIFEAGISQPGEMERLASIIAPTIGVFTNIGPAHGEHFQDDRTKTQEKAEIFRSAEAVIYSRDHAVVHGALQDHPGILRTWSRTQDAFLRVLSEQVVEATTSITLLHDGRTFTCDLPFTDQASVENALHCITTLLHLGRSIEHITERIHHLTPVAMRLEVLADSRNGTLINDAYSNDPASLVIALEHLVRTSGDRSRVVVLSDFVESNEPAPELYARVADALRRADVARVIGIGPVITAHRSFFPPDTLFFHDADLLLHALPLPPIDGAVTLVKGARHFGLERVVERWEQHTHGTVMEIDLDALRHNLNHYRERCGPQVRVMAMVKANGYGSGAVELARSLAHEQVDYLGVAYADEGIQLRQSGIHTPILVMNPEPVPIEVLHRFNLEAEVFDLRSLRAAIDFARHVPNAPPIHIKLDTGMHRLGFQAAEIPALVDALRNAAELRVASIFSHLAASEDEAQDDLTRKQIVSFLALADRVDEVLGYHPLRHIANSAAASRFAEARLDMVRLGIGLHGIGADAVETDQLQATATLRTVVAQVKEIPAGDGIGYGRRSIAPMNMRIAVLPIGYADGFLRRLGQGRGRVHINGQPAPVVGSVCMDMCMVDVTGIACMPGDTAVVFSAAHPLTEIARDLDTIPYEVLTSISPRVKRVFIHS